MNVTAIGPYLVLRKLGSGGMGDVYLAEDPRLRRRVALKRLNERMLAASGGRERLLGEARVAARLQHPNIAAVHDVLAVDDQLYIVMEYVEGETLAARLRRGPLPPRDAAAMAAQIADALTHAHGLGVIHRDLKPANICLTSDGRPRVLDFGVAKVSPDRTDATGTVTFAGPASEAGGLVGTPGFVAPEQLLGKRVDARADVYSLGVMLFEMLTGRAPYEGKDIVSLALAAATEPLPDAAAFNAAVPPALARACAQAMAVDPDARFQTAAAFQHAITDAMGRHASSTATTVPAPMQAARPAHRRWLWTAAATAVVGAALLAAPSLPWKSLFREGGAPSRHVIAVLPLSTFSTEPASTDLGIGMADALTTSFAKIGALTVIPRTALADFEKRKESPGRMARELDATYVVNGSVQQNAGRLKVTVQLVGRDDAVAWGDSFEAAVSDLFALQNEVAEAVAGALQVSLTRDDLARIGRAPTNDLQAFELYSRGRALLDRSAGDEDVAAAIDTLERAVQRDRAFAIAHAALGEAYWAQYEETKDPAWVDKATRATLEALRIDPEQPQVRLSLATVYRGTGRNDEAQQELRRVLAAHPDNDDAHRLLGGLYSRMGKADDAAAEFREAIRLRPNYWRHHRELGNAMVRAARYSDAVAAYLRETELVPESARAWHNLGSAYQLHRDFNRAQEAYKKALQFGPSGLTHSNLGVIHYEQRRYSEAAEAFQQALALGPPEAVLYGNLGDALRAMGRRVDAGNAYRTAIELSATALAVNPADALAHARLAAYHAKLGGHAAARRHIREALALNPKSADVAFKHAAVLALGGESRQALEALASALSLGYDVAAARRDDDLASLRTFPEYAALVAAPMADRSR